MYIYKWYCMCMAPLPVARRRPGKRGAGPPKQPEGSSTWQGQQQQQRRDVQQWLADCSRTGATLFEWTQAGSPSSSLTARAARRSVGPHVGANLDTAIKAIAAMRASGVQAECGGVELDGQCMYVCSNAAGGVSTAART